MMSKQYDSYEQEELIAIFSAMLRAPTQDGGKKRAAGLKPCWKDDDSHEDHFWNHLNAWAVGETVDKDSGAHPLQHAAWRLLALAYQENVAIADESYTQYEA